MFAMNLILLSSWRSLRRRISVFAGRFFVVPPQNDRNLISIAINSNSSDRKKYRQKFREIDKKYFWGKGAYSFWSKNVVEKKFASYISFQGGFATSGSKGRKYSNPYSVYKGKEFGMSVRLVRSLAK